MNNYWFIFLSMIVVSCKQEVLDPCSLEHLDQAEYSGYVSLCNAIPGSQQDFGAKAILSISDTILTISIQDTFANVSYNKAVTLTSECYEGEPGYFNHELYNLPSHQYIGRLHTAGTFLNLHYELVPCENTIHFVGHLN